MVEFKSIDPRRVDRLEGEVVSIREAVVAVEKTVAVLIERQGRVHEDMNMLNATLEDTNGQLQRLNRWADKKGAFVAGAVFVVTAIAGVAGTIMAGVGKWLF